MSESKKLQEIRNRKYDISLGYSDIFLLYHALIFFMDEDNHEYDSGFSQERIGKMRDRIYGLVERHDNAVSKQQLKDMKAFMEKKGVKLRT